MRPWLCQVSIICSVKCIHTDSALCYVVQAMKPVENVLTGRDLGQTWKHATPTVLSMFSSCSCLYLYLRWAMKRQSIWNGMSWGFILSFSIYDGNMKLFSRCLAKGHSRCNQLDPVLYLHLHAFPLSVSIMQQWNTQSYPFIRDLAYN